jgi:hypothetical protein
MTNPYPILWRRFWQYLKWNWVFESLGGSWSMVFLGEFYILMIKKIIKCKCYIGHRSFLGFFWQILPYFQGILLKVAMFRYYIHKSYQYKIRFRKKIYHPHRIKKIIWGDFQNLRAFLVGVGLIIMAQSEK